MKGLLMRDPKTYRNIVFDMGGILMDFDCDWVTEHFTDDPEIIRSIRNIFFYSSEWIRLDGGWISEETAYELIRPRFSTEKEREIFDLVFENWDKFNMHEKPGMKEVLELVHERGQHIYMLSNANLRVVGMYQRVVPHPEYFEGVFISAEHQVIKPQIEIYQKFLREFGLNAPDCLFIDDVLENVEGAKKAGIDAWQLTDGKAESIRAMLLGE